MIFHYCSCSTKCLSEPEGACGCGLRFDRKHACQHRENRFRKGSNWLASNPLSEFCSFLEASEKASRCIHRPREAAASRAFDSGPSPDMSDSSGYWSGKVLEDERNSDFRDGGFPYGVLMLYDPHVKGFVRLERYRFLPQQSSCVPFVRGTLIRPPVPFLSRNCGRRVVPETVRHSLPASRMREGVERHFRTVGIPSDCGLVFRLDPNPQQVPGPGLSFLTRCSCGQRPHNRTGIWSDLGLDESGLCHFRNAHLPTAASCLVGLVDGRQCYIVAVLGRPETSSRFGALRLDASAGTIIVDRDAVDHYVREDRRPPEQRQDRWARDPGRFNVLTGCTSSGDRRWARHGCRTEQEDLHTGHRRRQNAAAMMAAKTTLTIRARRHDGMNICQQTTRQTAIVDRD